MPWLESESDLLSMEACATARWAVGAWVWGPRMAYWNGRSTTTTAGARSSELKPFHGLQVVQGVGRERMHNGSKERSRIGLDHKRSSHAENKVEPW